MLSTVTALVNLMLVVRAAAAARITAGDEAAKSRRPRAAPAPAARRLRTLGFAPVAPGPGRPGRRLGAPGPAAHRRRPRRPAGLPRGPRQRRGAGTTRSSTAPSAELLDSDQAAPRRAAPTGTRRLTTVWACAPSACVPGGLARPRCRAGGTACRVRRAPAPRTGRAGAKACFPDHLTAGALVTRTRPASTCCSTCTSRPGGGSPSAVTWRTGGRHPRSGGAPRGHRGERARRTWCSTRCRCTLAARGRLLQPARTVRHLDVRFLAAARCQHPVVSDESLDIRWFPVDDLPTDEPDMVELNLTRLARR